MKPGLGSAGTAGEPPAADDDGGQLCQRAFGALKGAAFCTACVGYHWNRENRGPHGGHEYLGQSQDGRSGQDHEHDPERHYAQCGISMQHPFCWG